MSIKLVGNPAPAAWGSSGLLAFFTSGIQAVGPGENAHGVITITSSTGRFGRHFFHARCPSLFTLRPLRKSPDCHSEEIERFRRISYTVRISSPIDSRSPGRRIRGRLGEGQCIPAGNVQNLRQPQVLKYFLCYHTPYGRFAVEPGMVLKFATSGGDPGWLPRHILLK